MNTSIVEQLSNPLFKHRLAADRTALRRRFPAIGRVEGNQVLSLRPYMQSVPQKFLDDNLYEQTVVWLERRHAKESDRLREYLNAASVELDRALRHLREVNDQDWHDAPVKEGDDYALLRAIDRQFHPTYLRLVEGVLAPFTRIVAHFSRRDRGVGTSGLEMWSVAQELARGSMASAVASYRHVIRNSIAHGGIVYQQREILYRDKKADEVLTAREMVRLCDDLLDQCNAIAAALTTFLLLHKAAGYDLPRELQIQELREETASNWWHIDGTIPVQIPGASQLLIYATFRSRNPDRLLWSAVQTGILGEYFAQGFDRYFISIRSPSDARGWAAFDGRRLRELRAARTFELTQYQGVLDSWYYPKLIRLPKVVKRIHTLVTSIAVNWPLYREQRRIEIGSPAIVPRGARVHRNGWFAVLNGEVVIDDVSDITSVIRDYRRLILKMVRRAARPAHSGEESAKWLPLGFAQIAIFRKDFRRRRLEGFGLGPDLICTLRYQRISRMRVPDLHRSRVEACGKWRIAWNRAWLDQLDRSVETPSAWSLLRV